MARSIGAGALRALDPAAARPHRTRSSPFVEWLRALRPGHWAKNILVFAPVVSSHRIVDGQTVASATLATVAFCLCASAVYLLNDVLDASSDRLHPTKRQRPIASGTLPAPLALASTPALLVAALAISTALPKGVALTLLVYVAVATLYSLILKRFVLIDVIALAGLYTCRIVAGLAATGVRATPLFLAFSVFLFTSLALVKRHAETAHAPLWAAGRTLPGRGYVRGDRSLLPVLGISCGQISVLVLALYVNSPEATLLYPRPLLLWALCPLLLYWLGRLWLLAHRGAVDDDPLVFVATDKPSWAVAALCAAILLAASGNLSAD